MNDNQLVSTCGDGSVKLWDLQSPGFPLMSWEEHQAEGKHTHNPHHNMIDRTVSELCCGVL